MDTLRVDIRYRPLRIGWAIKSNDFEAYRKAVRFSNALWGGQFNPILFVDQEEHSDDLVDLFKIDMIVPICDEKTGKKFKERYSYLEQPFFNDSIFIKADEHSRSHSNVLDLQNILSYLRDTNDLSKIKDIGLKCYEWDEDDPLADIFLPLFGGYPNKDEVGLDYLELLKKIVKPDEVFISSTNSIPNVVIDSPGISTLSIYGLKRYYGDVLGWNKQGFFVGNVSNLEDLVCYWNLRACTIPLWFIDPDYLDRYKGIIPALEELMQELISTYRFEWQKKIALWTRWDDSKKALKPFGDKKFNYHYISDIDWNGLNVRAPSVYFSENSVLSVVSSQEKEHRGPRITFTLPEKPFCADYRFHQQYLVASLSFFDGLLGDDENTLHVPYLPELNKFYARKMHPDFNKVRVEPGRLGLIIHATERDSFIYALRVSEVIEQIFDMAGYEVQLSNAGLITKQLIERLGGLQGGRVFKIPGVRRLLKAHGPKASITKNIALQLIGSNDPDRPKTKFSDHKDLHIEYREFGKKLTPHDVFRYLVKKDIFRIGVDLKCPSCKLNSWIPLDSLKQTVVCDLCGGEYSVNGKLADLNEWHYRRSGVFGIEKNAQGAVPVILTLQQLDANFDSGFYKSIYSPSLNLTPKPSTTGVKCETDFVWVIPKAYPDKTVIVIAECKDLGPITNEDITNLKGVIDSLPPKRFETYVILSQISPFTDKEIKIAQQLNDEYSYRAILLSADELEPYYIRSGKKNETYENLEWSSPKEMALSTALIYFSSK